MIGGGAAIALILVLAADSQAIACSATVLFDADVGGGKSDLSIREGEKLVGLNRMLRDPTTSDVVICSRIRCYPAFALDQNEQPREVLQLEGCRVIEASAIKNGLERHEIEDTKIKGKRRRDTFKRRHHNGNRH